MTQPSFFFRQIIHLSRNEFWDLVWLVLLEPDRVLESGFDVFGLLGGDAIVALYLEI